MKLAAKGRYAPPPSLPTHAQSVSESLARWPAVHARTHWFLGDEREVDGADFYVGEEELGHLHLDGEAHIAVTRALREALTGAGVAKPFRWSASFVVFRVRSAADVEHALGLFGLAYDRLRGTPEAELLARIPTLGAELPTPRASAVHPTLVVSADAGSWCARRRSWCWRRGPGRRARRRGA